jgi:hypothetical protein
VDSRDALRATSHSNRLPAVQGQVAGSGQTATTDLHLRLPATRPSATILRAELATWLRSLGTANAVIFDLQLACAEVFTIFIGRPGRRSALVIDSDAAVAAKTITITMREFGLCHEADHLPATRDQALGLSLIEAMTETFDIRNHTQGRTFILQRSI